MGPVRQNPIQRLTACTPGSAPGPTLGIEYGKAFTFTFFLVMNFSLVGVYNSTVSLVVVGDIEV